MIVSEEKAKRLLSRYGLQTPGGAVARTPEEARGIAQESKGPVVVKALIPAGGRGKAGGVKVCTSPQEAYNAAAGLLGQPLLDHTVDQVLVEAAVEVVREIYAGVIANTGSGYMDLIASFEGGMDIERTAEREGNAILHLEVDPGADLPVHRVREWLRKAPAVGIEIEALAHTFTTLYRAAADLDAMLLEINPLALVESGDLMLLDCKLEVDDNGLVRQPQLSRWFAASLSERERRARDLGVSYVPLDGDIGVITSGAGLGMATLDLLKRSGLSAANFLDTGGGISEAMVKGALELILEPQEVRGAILNLYGGINRMVEAAKGILAALENIPGERPVVVKILGNQQEEAWAMLSEAPQVQVIKTVQTEAAVEKLAELVS